MKILISGNTETGVAGALAKIYPDATYCSRTTGYDLTQAADQKRFAELALEHDVIINCAALWRFEQTNLLDAIYRSCSAHEHRPHIVCIGSTTDRVKNGKPWLYNAEKKALRDYSNTLAIGGVWSDKPKVTYVSFGTMSNNAHKHPDRKCLDIDSAAQYVKWIIEQPKNIAINEISIDPMQDDFWYD